MTVPHPANALPTLSAVPSRQVTVMEKPRSRPRPSAFPPVEEWITTHPMVWTSGAVGREPWVRDALRRASYP